MELEIPRSQLKKVDTSVFFGSTASIALTKRFSQAIEIEYSAEDHVRFDGMMNPSYAYVGNDSFDNRIDLLKK